MNEPLKIVLDTSVLVAACFKSASVEILQRWESGEFVLCCSRPVRSEYEAVLYRIPPIREPVDRFFQTLDSNPNVVWVENPPVIPVDIEDANDVKFIACAVGAGAEFLITLDDHLLSLGEYESVRMVRPTDFLRKDSPAHE